MNFTRPLCAVVVVGAAIGYVVASSIDASAGYAPIALSDEAAPVEDSMHEFMEYVFQPTYLRLKSTMAAAPADNKGWKALKSDSLILAESCNLLFGRKPDEHGDDWVKHAAASKSQGAALYKAAREKNFESATAAWKSMLDNCNGCHRQFESGKHILQP
ncbi:MAG: cytochrome c [Planctomycetaceae bacterium]|nr:cytochrome c [Planctomycetaceae bacterium]